MKKFYCFYCQQEVEPRRFIKWRFCPKCGKYLKDSGEGFYRICNRCGANMPVDASACYKCGNSTGLPEEKYTAEKFLNLSNWAYFLQNCMFFALCIVLLIGIIYLSFYLIMAALFCFAIFYCLSFFMPKNK